jgi:hypothetical protein
LKEFSHKINEIINSSATTGKKFRDTNYKIIGNINKSLKTEFKRKK